MKLIGKLEDGAILVGMSQSQFDALAILSGFYDGTFRSASEVGRAVPCAPSSSVGAGVPSPRSDAAGAGVPSPRSGSDVGGAPCAASVRARPARRTPRSVDVRCKQCHKIFPRLQGSRRQCCSDECLKQFNREYGRRRWREKHGKPLDAPVIDVKARRLEMIKASVARANAAKEKNVQTI